MYFFYYYHLLIYEVKRKLWAYSGTTLSYLLNSENNNFRYYLIVNVNLVSSDHFTLLARFIWCVDVYLILQYQVCCFTTVWLPQTRKPTWSKYTAVLIRQTFEPVQKGAHGFYGVMKAADKKWHNLLSWRKNTIYSELNRSK